MAIVYPKEKPTKIDYTKPVNNPAVAYQNTKAAQNEYAGYEANKSINDSFLNKLNSSNSAIDETLKAVNQGWWDKTANAVVQTGATAVGDLVQTAGSLFSVPARVHTLVTGETEDFTNVVSQWGEDIIKAGETNFPIHRLNPNKSFDFGDWGYWASQAPGAIGSSLGMMAGGYGIFKGGLKLLNLTDKFSRLSGTAQKLWQAGVMSGVMRDTENFMEAHGVYTKTYEDNSFVLDLKDKDYKKLLDSLPEGLKSDIKNLNDREEVRKHIASAAGYRDYRNNAINFVFDFVEMAALLNVHIGLKEGGSKFGMPINVMKADIMETTGKAASKLDIAKNIGYRTGKVALWQGVPEAAEETVNALSELEGLHYGKYLSGELNKAKQYKTGKEADNREYTERLFEDYLKNPTVYEQAFWGFIGGVGTGSIFKAVDRLTGIKDRKATEQEAILTIAARNQNIAELNVKFKKIKNGINPLTEKPYIGDEETIKGAKELATEEAINTLSAQYAKAWARTQTIDSGIEWLNNPTTIKKLVDAGFGDTKEVKKVIDTITSNVKADAKFLDDNSSVLFSPIINDGIRHIMIADALGNKKDLEMFKKRAEFYSKEKLKLDNDAYYKSLTDEEKVALRQDIERFAQITTYNQLLTFVNNSKVKYKNHPVITKQLNDKLKEFEKAYNFEIISTDENEKVKEFAKQKSENGKVLHRVRQAVRGKNDGFAGLQPHHLENFASSLKYNEASKYKEVEINTVLNNPTFQKGVENELKSAKEKATQKFIKDTKDRIDLLIIDASKKPNEAGYMSRKEFEDKLTAISTSPDFELTGIRVEEVKNELETKLAKVKVTEEKNDIEAKEVPFPFTAEEQAMYDANTEDINAFVSPLLTIPQLEYLLESQIDPILDNPNSSIEDINTANMYKKHIKNVLHFKTPFKSSDEKEKEDISERFEDLNTDDIILNDSIQGGENSFNAYLGPAENFSFRTMKNGVIVLDDSNPDTIDAVAITLNLKAGDQVHWRKAVSDDFSSPDEFARLAEESNNEIIVGTVNEVPIMFINTEDYLVAERIFTNNVLQALDDKGFESLFESLKSLYNREVTDLEKANLVADIKENSAFKLIYGESYSDIDLKLNHLQKIVFFNLPYKKREFNKENLQKSLKDWDAKIYRDLKNRPKIVNKIIEASKTGEDVVTDIAYTSTGSLIIAVNKSGDIQYNRVDTMLGAEKGDIDGTNLFVVDKTNPSILSPAIGSDTHLPTFQNKDGLYENQIYSSAEAGNGDLIPVPLVMNKLKTIGSVEKASFIGKTDQKRIDYIVAKGKEILALLDSGVALQDDRIKELKDAIENHVIINHKNEEENLYLKFYNKTDKTSARMEYTAEGNTYNLYKNGLSKNGVFVDNASFKGELNTSISHLTRSFKYELLAKNEPFFDEATGKKYKSYKHFLIESNALMTYVGKMVTTEGEKISNFTVKPNTNLMSSRPMIVSIDTSFKRKRVEEYSNTKEIEQELLDNASYKFVYDKFIEYGLTIEPEFRVATMLERGGYDPSTTSVYMTSMINAHKDRAVLTLVHEMIHGILKKSGIPAELKARLDAYNTDLVSVIAQLEKGDLIIDENNRTEILELLQNDEVKQILNKINPSNKKYEFEEVVTYGFTSVKFARLLALLPSDKTGVKTGETLWQKLKKLIINIVELITGNSKLDELTNILDDIFTTNGTGNTSNSQEEGTGGTDSTTKGTDTTDTEDEDDTIEFNLDNIDLTKAIPLPTNEYWYKHYNLLTNEGKIKSVVDNKQTKEWLNTLNLSHRFTFKLRNTTGGKKILIFPKEDLISNNVSNILDNSKNITNEEVQNRINKCK